ncbi:indolepyruvate ferredoxin oxidoreductase family protein [Ectothiorhodospiraceae bacterium WFHF3C12]|nr:indolepyruvate ferredoxin oxidoreductase family protein [Ectothiorhodospiraceae bacterium WFHF3C12]
MAVAQVSLQDKYTLNRGRIFITGLQALVRLPLMQRALDSAAGLDTACLISGYRGSPLGGLDLNLWRAETLLKAQRIRFQPGLNEDLAATALWGSQQVGLSGDATADGVFGLWYGKGPGVDRSGDVFRHANLAGTAPHGGVLAVAGDDPGCKSSTLPSQCEHAFMDVQMPLLNPADVQDVLDFGLYGWALSRFSGCWVGMKMVSETADASASVYVDPERVRIALPEDFELPPDGVHIRWPDPPMDQEKRLHRYKLYAALAFARANGLNRIIMDSPQPRLGIVTTGKAFLNVRQALADLGIDETEAARLGLRLYKVGMSWPLERDGIRRFAEGLEEVLVVEEKRAFIENQLKEQLYNWREDVRPRVVGKFDEGGDWLLPSTGELTPAMVARVIGARLARFYTSAAMERRLRELAERETALASTPVLAERRPHFCSGCPHNTSTRVPEGSRALAGIGCHYMAIWMDRNTETFTHMGGEGVTWLGQAPFVRANHVFANMGDGTYEHSGILAIRAAVAAGANITYKILYNDAVAMTGGQPVEGGLSVAQITRELHAEGVRRIAVVTDAPEKYPSDPGFAPETTVHERHELDALQRTLRETPGVTALVYDQTCAAELRRRRKRGKAPDPPKRAFINERVCEGCGDCNAKSNCLAVVPMETPFGRKRAIDQGQCNKDFSCLDGFCPSFVTVEGGELRRPEAAAGGDVDFPEVPEPQRPDKDGVYNIFITGVGGTGVVTVGALLGMAAHIEGKGVGVLDVTGLAQKYGAVTTHLRVGDSPEAVHGARIPTGEADLLLGCDLVVSASSESLSELAEGAAAVINRHRVMPSGFTRDPDLPFPAEGMEQQIRGAVPEGRYWSMDAADLAGALLGDALMANVFLMGFAYQKGLIPLSAGAIDQAIELNGVAVDRNRQAFLWGRRAAFDAARVRQAAGQETETGARGAAAEDLEAVVERRRNFLVGYQNEAYAERYAKLVERVRREEARHVPGSSSLSEAVARSYFRLLAYKDEYEVARLYTDGDFRDALRRNFQGNYRVRVHLAPPLLARKDPVTGEPRKRAFGAWIMPFMSVLARLRFLRGTALDPFGYSRDRRLEHALLAEYESLVDELLQGLNADNHDTAVALARLPEDVRGYGHVKARNAEQARRRQTELLARFHGGRERVAA